MMQFDTSKNIANFSPESITPSGFFGNSENLIIELENFLTEEEIRLGNEFARNNSSFDETPTEYNENGTVIYDHSVWKNRVATYKLLEQNAPHMIPVLRGMINRLQPIIETFLKVEIEPTGPAIVRWPPGARQEPHADKELHEGPDAGKPNAFPWYDIATIFYFNDDYTGGELYFPVQGIQLKPKVGAVYFFPGDMNYIHGVRPVKTGTRYTAPYFWTIRKLPEKFDGPGELLWNK